MPKPPKAEKTPPDKPVKRRHFQQEDIKKALMNVMADLKESSARSEAILASIADGVIVIGRNGIIILMNRSAEKLLGWTNRKSIGEKWFQILKREDEKGNPILPEKGAIKKALTGGVTTLPSPTDSHLYVRKNGTKFPVSRTVSPIMIDKKVVGAVLVFHDVTKDKELDRLKDEFIDVAAHDLRTPATVIRGFISRVLDGDAGKISTKANGLLKEAYKGNIRLIDLIDDFLVVSRFERGKIKFFLKTNDLAGIIEEAVRNLSGLAKSKDLTLNYKKTALPAVLIDKERTFQILNNLIGNAIKFTEKGGIKIWHQKEKEKVITHITDTGSGVPLSEQSNIFQKYSKGKTGRNRSGLGLGLYISQLCLKGMGGKIWVKSEEGKGSTFSFSLPVAKGGKLN